MSCFRNERAALFTRLKRSILQTLHVLNGNISEAESKVYMDRAKEKSLGVFLFKQLDTIFYLHTKPDRCKGSVNARDGVDKVRGSACPFTLAIQIFNNMPAQDTPRDYLKDLDYMHTYALIKV